MDITQVPAAGFEDVRRAVDPGSGLVAYIAVHDTTLGPALGGLRMWPYPDPGQGLSDVLRLAEGMTYKNAVARTGLGGGKAVIVGDPARDKSTALFHAMGRFVDAFAGRYITAEDVGTCVEDMRLLGAATPHVTGLPLEEGSSGDPSPHTALGVYLGIRATLAELTGSDSVRGRRVAIQGLGAVGAGVGRLLAAQGATLVVADLEPDRVERFLREAGGRAVAPEEVLAADCDVLSPCALGGVIRDETLPRLRCRAVAGAANNQLAEARHGVELARRGILYAPDFVINAGGVINIAVGLGPGGYDPERARRRVESVPEALREVYSEARSRGISTHESALRLARRNLEAGRRPAAARERRA
ncbi:MAG: Glu/Leu/Phe/Val dehydrogenase [Planctomycetes bacterium]|nr:Glu/Leu/Phe/Val dehydrogenase [Planctomycetota bacterium]